MVERIACRSGDFAIGRDFSFWDGANDAAEGGVAGLIFAEGIFENSSLEILRGSRWAHEQNFIREAMAQSWHVSIRLRLRFSHAKISFVTNSFRPNSSSPGKLSRLCRHPNLLAFFDKHRNPNLNPSFQPRRLGHVSSCRIAPHTWLGIRHCQLYLQ